MKNIFNNKIITFCKTNIEYTLSTGGLGNFIVPNPFTYKTEDPKKTLSSEEPRLEEYIWDAINGINISQNRKKNLNKVVLDNLFIIPPEKNLPLRKQ
ncbi:hypothetical protein JK636_20380 [Clostridium sp. YIM B02515]|uniref:Uncharacterized protein n=1 Tax=Clostridium rhizosphaerae TaxID=2803861 RepID=A0ABS1TFE5_9CLOT|nr:hypothetical protein [Clostridium rhizosphaerae]